MACRWLPAAAPVARRPCPWATARAPAAGRCLIRLRAAAGDAAGPGPSPSSSVDSDAVAPATPAPAALRWGTAISLLQPVDDAIEEAIAGCIAGGAGPERPDLAVVFVSSYHADRYRRVIPALRERLPHLRAILGCSAYGVIGSGAAAPDGSRPPTEVEDTPGLSLALGCLPGVGLDVWRMTPSTMPDLDGPQRDWAEALHVPSGPAPAFITLADPTFSGIKELLAGLDYASPGATKVGGLSSSARRDSRRALFAWSPSLPPPAAATVAGGSGDGCYTGQGVVGLTLGGVTLESIVAQGCAAVGGTYRITKAVRNVILQLERVGGRGGPISALDALQQMLGELSAAELARAQETLLVAVAQDTFRAPESLCPDDFLCRGLVGLDPKVGALAMGEKCAPGQYLRFMVRDKATAESDLRERCLAFKRRELDASLAGSPPAPIFGALLFTCTGRGRGLYGEGQDSVDARLLNEFVRAPVAGFACAGEIGRVGDATALHGFTAVAGVLRAGRVAAEPATGGEAMGGDLGGR